MNKCNNICPIQSSLEIIGGKWKFLIIWHLKNGTLRYSDLKRSLGEITHKMLTQELKSLEKNNVLKRKVYPVVPPKVEYTLTELGSSLLPILEKLGEWGQKAKELTEV